MICFVLHLFVEHVRATNPQTLGAVADALLTTAVFASWIDPERAALHTSESRSPIVS